MTADAVGGIWTYALDLARGLARRRARVTLAVIGPGLTEDKRHAAEAAGLAVVPLEARPEWLADGPAEVSRGGESLAELARAVGATLLHLNHPAFAADAAFPAPTLVACHSCVATWWAAVRGTALPADFVWQTELIGRAYRRADVLVAPSRAFAEATQRTYGLTDLPRVISNGRDIVPSAPAISVAGPRHALTAGRLWDEGKGLAVVDAAAGAVSVPVVAVGPTRGPNGAEVALRHVQAVGSVPEADLRARLASRPVYVSAALYEPFGLAVLEAAQAGCPLVLSDIPTFRELWDGIARFVPARDAAGFAAAIDAITADSDLHMRMGAAAQDASRRFGLAPQVDAMMALYGRLRPGDAAPTRSA